MKRWKAGPHRNQLDRLCREFVFLRDGSKCQKCGRSIQLQWCHLISRSKLSVRWSIDPPNSIVLCAGCHFDAHSNPLTFTTFVLKRLGQSKFDELVLKSNRPAPLTPTLFEQIKQELERAIEDLRQEVR